MIQQTLIAVVIFGTVVGTLYVLFRPHWAFVLIAAMWPIEQLLQVYVGFLATHNKITNFLIGGLAFSAVVTRLARREPILAAYRNPVTFLVLLFYLHWLMGILYSPSRDIVAE